MSGIDTTAELQAVADRVVEQARAGEQIEAFVSRGGETEVRVHQGDVEHFVSAQAEGIGIRVVKDGRTGFAYAGTLDEAAVREVLAEAWKTWSSAWSTNGPGLRSPTVSSRRSNRCGTTCAEFATDRKIDIAKELEKLALGSTPRVRVDDANYADAWGEAAVASTAGIRQSGRENGCYVSVSTLADEGEGDDAETQTGFGFSVGKSPDEFDLNRAAEEASDRATRLLVRRSRRQSG